MKTSRSRFLRWGPLGDVLVAGIILCVFALFHHVIPVSYEQPLVTDPPTIEDNHTVLTPMEQLFEEQTRIDPILTENSYQSENILVKITTHTQGEGDSLITYHVADVYVRSMKYLCSAFAKDTYGRGYTDDILNIAKQNNAIFAVSGDYYSWNNSGPVIRNGVLYRDKKGTADVCALYTNGEMKVFSGRAFDAKAEMENGIWQAWCFGPSLLTADGKAATSFNSTLTAKHPRCAIGYYEPGHYAFVLVDGRQDDVSVGMTLSELANLFESMGCKSAYNLDGGRSAQMAFNNDMVNSPYLDGRVVSDIIFLGEAE